MAVGWFSCFWLFYYQYNVESFDPLIYPVSKWHLVEVVGSFRHVSPDDPGFGMAK